GAEAAIDVGHGAAGGSVGVDAPDRHGEQDGPEASGGEQGAEGEGDVGRLDMVERQDGDDDEEVADLHGGGTPDAGEAGQEDDDGGQRDDDGEAEGPEQAQSAGDEGAEGG